MKGCVVPVRRSTALFLLVGAHRGVVGHSGPPEEGGRQEGENASREAHCFQRYRARTGLSTEAQPEPDTSSMRRPPVLKVLPESIAPPDCNASIRTRVVARDPFPPAWQLGCFSMPDWTVR
jgi:hypothetical protein